MTWFTEMTPEINGMTLKSTEMTFQILIYIYCYLLVINELIKKNIDLWDLWVLLENGLRYSFSVS